MTDENVNALPKKARMDLLTELALQRLVTLFEAPPFVAEALREIERDTDNAYLRELGVKADTDER
jgi:hypothetical protein